MKRILLTFLFLFCFVSFVNAGTSISGRPAAGGAAAPSCTTSNDVDLSSIMSAPTGTGKLYGAADDDENSLDDNQSTLFTLSDTAKVTAYIVRIYDNGDTDNDGVTFCLKSGDNTPATGTCITGTTKVVESTSVSGVVSDYEIDLDAAVELEAGTYRLVAIRVGPTNLTWKWDGVTDGKACLATSCYTNNTARTKIMGCTP